MSHEKKVSVIIGFCIVLIGIFSAFILYKTLLPSNGLPYEMISMEQAAEYMEYEEGYIILDVRTEEEYRKKHISGAVCIPLEELAFRAEQELPDKEQMIYVYGDVGQRSVHAAQLLCDMEYSNITEIGDIDQWKGKIVKEE